jgi:hypothetical protein
MLANHHEEIFGVQEEATHLVRRTQRPTISKVGAKDEPLRISLSKFHTIHPSIMVACVGACSLRAPLSKNSEGRSDTSTAKVKDPK